MRVGKWSMSKKPTHTEGIAKNNMNPEYLEFVPLGGADEVGRSCYLIGDGERYIMLDCGTSPKGGNPPRLELVGEKRILGVLVSHSHLDHIGALPLLIKSMSNVRIYSTKLTKELSLISLKDAAKVSERRGESSINLSPEVEKNWKVQEYGEEFQLDEGITAKFIDAGHIPGSAQVLLNWKGLKLVYTGDVCMFKTNLSGQFQPWEKVDIVITESTYGNEFSKFGDKKNTILEEEALVREIGNVLRRKGRVLIPAFANGRAQELMFVIAKAIEEGKLPKVPCYSVGLLNTMLEAIGGEAAYLEKVEVVRKHFEPVGFPRIYAEPEQDKKFEAMKKTVKPSIIVSTPGMLTMGASANLAIKFFDEPKSAIFIVGYQDEDSPGRLLEQVEKGKKFAVGGSVLEVRCDVKKFEIRGHSRPEDIVGAVVKARPKLVILVHGAWEAQNKLKTSIKSSLPNSKVFVSTKRICLRFYPSTSRYELVPLPKPSEPEKTELFVVDGLLSKVPEELMKEKVRTVDDKLSEEEWIEAIVKAKFIASGVKIPIRSRFWISAGGYPKRVRAVVKGTQSDIVKATQGLFEETKILKAAARMEWLPFEGKVRFNEVASWLGRYLPKAKKVQIPKFDCFPLGEGINGLYKRTGRIYINPVVAYDEDLKRTVLYHEIVHHLMDTLRGDVEELAKKGFEGKAFVEGSAEYVAYKLGERIFIETEKIGDDGIYYPTSSSNPYTYGWYMFKCIDEIAGEEKAVEIMFKGSPKSLKRMFAWVKGTSKMLDRFLRATKIVDRLYLLGMPHMIEGKVRAALLYAPTANEGRLYVDNKAWVIKDLRERKSILYRLGRLFGVIKHPWVEARCIGEKEKEDFRYRIPPEHIRIIKVHRLYPVVQVSEGVGKVADEAKKAKRMQADKMVSPQKGLDGLKYCYKCGAKMQRTAKFCPVCGRKQPEGV
ncbi:MAG: MBL fold metallo-hydrolase [Candidatus Hadarchaeales archaeon]